KICPMSPPTLRCPTRLRRGRSRSSSWGPLRGDRLAEARRRLRGNLLYRGPGCLRVVPKATRARQFHPRDLEAMFPRQLEKGSRIFRPFPLRFLQSLLLRIRQLLGEFLAEEVLDCNREILRTGRPEALLESGLSLLGERFLPLDALQHHPELW